MAKREASVKNMSAEEIAALYGDVHNALVSITKEELRQIEAVNGKRQFTLLVDRKRLPLDRVKYRVEVNFLKDLSGEILKTLRNLASKRSYKVVHKISGHLGADWTWYFNGRPISDPSTIKSFSPDDFLWLVSMVDYSVQAQRKTRELDKHSIIAQVARALRRNSVFKRDFAFYAIYPIIDGRRRPTVGVKLRKAAGANVTGG